MEPTTETVSVIATGSAELDAALGIGGLPCGRVIELTGGASSGKLPLVLGTLATAQRAGKTCAVIDTGANLDVTLVAASGVDLGELLVSQPETPAQALDIINTLIATGAIDLIVILGDLAVSPHTASQWLRQITARVHRVQTAVLFVTDRPALSEGLGQALKFYSSVRLDVTRAPGGVRVRVIKNKCAAPFTEALIADQPARAGWCPEED